MLSLGTLVAAVAPTQRIAAAARSLLAVVLRGAAARLFAGSDEHR
jgi:hypothetical protein